MAVFGQSDTFTPNPKQARFLASTADILLYGGGAGSGKSLTALIWLLGLNNGVDGKARWEIDSYNGLIFRKNRKDLADLVKKSKVIYKAVDPGAVYNNQDNFWRFSSGATIFFSYFERFEQCESQIQGQEYQSIVAEEVGQHETDQIFLYCISRLRGSNGLKPFMRATANPGRYRWLREFFRIGDDGGSTDFKQVLTLLDGTFVEKRIQYIQALLSDNPHVSKEYEASLMLLGIEERKALLEGRWDAYTSVAGQIYEHELKLMQEERRFCAVRHDKTAPVHTFWDLGINDHCVILFVQFVGKEVRLIDMLKGNNLSIRNHWIPEIQRKGMDKGYVYDGHWLPHDSAQRDKFSGESIFESVKKVLGNVHRLPRPNMKLEAIQKARNMFDSVWIDKVNCQDLFDDLSNYKRQKDEANNVWSNEPVHNAASHGADAFSYVAYYKRKPAVQAARVEDAASLSPFVYR